MQQHIHGGLRKKIPVVIHGCQGDAGQSGVEQIVKADDGKILRYAIALFQQGIHGAQGDHIVHRDNGSTAPLVDTRVLRQLIAGVIIIIVAHGIFRGCRLSVEKLDLTAAIGLQLLLDAKHPRFSGLAALHGIGQKRIAAVAQ